MITSQSELIEPGSSNEDLQNKNLFVRRSMNIQKRITNLILDMPITPTHPKKEEILRKINEKKQAAMENNNRIAYNKGYMRPN